jgi:hypothetical protein
MKKPLNFSNFKLKQATMEVRFNNAYLLWDHSGLISSDLKSKWADIKLLKAKPNLINFRFEDRYELSVELGKAHLTDLTPTSSLKEFMENADTFMALVADNLVITEFTRLGFRLIYRKKFNDKVEAASSLISTELIKVPNGRHFNIDGKVLMPHYSLVWEGKATAIRVILMAKEQKLDLEVPPGLEGISPIHSKWGEIVYDIDYYTLKNTSRGQLNIKEWINQAYHLIKRDSKVFLEI